MLPEAEARRVVSVIGDSTFLHTGLNGIVEMVYNRPPTGHVVLILDNSTTAMTGMQEHPGTGPSSGSHACTDAGVAGEGVRGDRGGSHRRLRPTLKPAEFEELLKARLSSNDCSVIICRRPCILAAAKIKSYEGKN